MKVAFGPVAVKCAVAGGLRRRGVVLCAGRDRGAGRHVAEGRAGAGESPAEQRMLLGQGLE